MALEVQKPSWARRSQIAIGALVLLMGSAQGALLALKGGGGAGGGRAWFGALAVFGGGLGFIHRSPAGPWARWIVTVLAVSVPWIFVAATR
ncbi:MAG: hypothetical protein HY791_24865 [Deltaproteobacteria bacterium]|nr:hypothetical protein [Deltaproteobacteria bacterium]